MYMYSCLVFSYCSEWLVMCDFRVCLSVCLSVQGLGRPGNELMAAAGTYGRFELVGLFVYSLQKEALPVLLIVGCKWRKLVLGGL